MTHADSFQLTEQRLALTSRNKQKFTGLYQELLMNPAEMCHVAAGAETEARGTSPPELSVPPG